MYEKEMNKNQLKLILVRVIYKVYLEIIFLNKRKPIIIKKKLVRALIGSLQNIMLCLSQ